MVTNCTMVAYCAVQGFGQAAQPEQAQCITHQKRHLGAGHPGTPPCKMRYTIYTVYTPAIYDGCTRSLRTSHSMYCIIPRSCDIYHMIPARLITRLLSPVWYREGRLLIHTLHAL